MFTLKSRAEYLKEILSTMTKDKYWPKLIKGNKDDKIIKIVNDLFKDYIEEEITEENKYEIFIKYNFLNLINSSVSNLTNLSQNSLYVYYFDLSCFTDDFFKLCL